MDSLNPDPNETAGEFWTNDRRTFLKSVGVGAGVLLGGGLLKYRSTQAARAELKENLLSEMNPLLTDKAHEEFSKLPNQASEEIRTWFHGPCLNAAAFAASVTSEDFCERVSAAPNEQQRERLFQIEFFRIVVSPEDILRRVYLIAEEVGGELDRNWKKCCLTMSKRWNLHLTEYNTAVSTEWTASLEPIIRHNLDQTIQQAKTMGQRPALSDSALKTGMSAVLLLPLVSLSTWMVPVFAVAALAPAYAYFRGHFHDSTGEIRESISARIANLGLRIGTEFRDEVKKSISRLQEWQKQAIQATAQNHAENAVGYF